MSSEDNKPVKDDILTYRFFEDAKICVISLGGNFSYKNKEACEAILEEIKKVKSPIIVINFRDVQRVDKNAHRFLVLLQNVIRVDLMAQLRVCELKIIIKGELMDIGILKPVEYFSTIKEALIGEKKVK